MANIKLTANEKQFVSAMDNAAGAVGRFSAELNIKMARALRETDAISKNFQKGFGQLGDKISSVGRTLSTSLTLPLSIAGGMAAKVYGDIDQLKRGLDAYGISLNEIKKTAKLPGLGLEEAAKSTITFASVKFAADVSTKAVREFGNALIYSGRGKEELAGIATAFAQMKGKGNVMAQEINQIAERLPMIRDLMMQAFGTSDTEVLQKQGISADVFLAKIVGQMEKLPRVAGGFKVGMENVIDSLKLGAYESVNIADKLFGLTGMMNSVSEYIDKAVESFKQLSPEMQSAIFAVAGLTATIGPLMVAIGVAIKSYALLFSGTALLTAGLAALALAIGGIVYLMIDYSATQTKIANASKNLAQLENEVKISIHGQAEEVRKHTDVLNSNNSTLAQRKTAIEALKAISPEYFGKLDSEKIKYDDLNVSVSKYITNLENAAKANLIKSQIETNIKAEKDLLDNLGSATSDVEKMRAKFDQGLARGLKSLMGSSSDFENDESNKLADVITLNAANALTKIRQSRVSLEEELVRLAQLGYKPTELSTPKNIKTGGIGGGYGKGSIPTGDPLKDYLKRLQEQRNILGKLNLKELSFTGEGEFNKNYGAKATPSFFQNIIDAGERLKKALPQIMTGIDLSQAGLSIEQQIRKNIGDKAKLALMELQESMGQTIAEFKLNAAVDLASGIGEAIGTAISGGGFDLSKVFSGILSNLGSMMIQLGKQLLVYGKLFEAAKVLFKANPIAGGIAMIAAGGIIRGVANSAFSKAPRFAQGGMVLGPTMAVMGDNASGREMALPWEKTGIFAQAIASSLGGGGGGMSGGISDLRLRGEDLYFAIERYKRNNGIK